MKRIKFLIPVLALLFMVSCNKSDYSSVKQELSSNAKTPTTTVIEFSENPVVLGNSVTITGSIDPVPNAGKLRVEMAVDIDGNPTTAALQVDYITVAEVDATAGVVTYTYTPTVTGATGYRIHFIPSNGSDYSQHHTAGVDLIVIDNCSTMNLAAAITSSSMSNGIGTFTVTYRLTSCANYTDVKIQGGLTAGSTGISYVPAPSNVKTTKQNTIINWIEPIVGIGFNKSYSVTFTRKLSGNGPWVITGEWSAKGKDENGVEFVAGYKNAQIFYAPF